MPAYDVIIRDAYLQEDNKIADIGIADGYIKTISESIEGTASESIDARENLVSPSFTDCHMHNDRSFSICGGRHPVGNEYEPDAVGLRESYCHGGFDEHFADLSVGELTENIIRDIQRTVASGTGHVRTHVSMDHVSDPMLVEATLNARDELTDVVDVQLVPYVADSLKNDDARNLLYEGLEIAIDRAGDDVLLGGIGTGPKEGKHIDGTIENWFDIATEFDLDIDVHIQDHGSLGAYTIEQLISETDARGFNGRVTASHCYALGDLPDPWFGKILDLAEDVNLKMTTCFSSTPCTWPLREITSHQIPLGHGTDNTHDYIMPYGISDSILGILIESIKLTHFEGYAEDVFWYQSNEGLRALWDLITYEGASVLDLDEYGVAEGCRADLVVLDEPSQEWAIARQAGQRYVLKSGRVVAENGMLLPEYDALA